MTEFNFTKLFKIKGTGPNGEKNVLILGLATLAVIALLGWPFLNSALPTLRQLISVVFTLFVRIQFNGRAQAV